MSEIAPQYNPKELSEIYAKLNKQDVEQFNAGYQWWNLQQRSVFLQEQIEELHREIAANAELMEMAHPPAIALATIARLQASGVKDLDLLDRMLERGEDWLDHTMQWLDYCEQLDFILDDYTQWCQNALEGAYDWIDSMREGGGTVSSIAVPSSDSSTEATEELLLQKLTREEEEQSPLPETTLELSPSAVEEPVPILEEPLSIIPEEPPPISEDQATIIEEPQGIVETPSSLEEASPELQVSQVSQVSQPVEVSHASDSPDEESITQENVAPDSQPSQPVEASLPTDSPGEAIPASGVLTEESDLEELSEDSIDEASEVEQLISQVYIEFNSPPEELPSVEGDDGSDFRQFPTQEHTVATEEALHTIDESPMYWEKPLPYRMYPSDKQPGIEAQGLEDAEQGIPIATPGRRRNFLQRLIAKIWRG